MPWYLQSRDSSLCCSCFCLCLWDFWVYGWQYPWRRHWHVLFHSSQRDGSTIGLIQRKTDGRRIIKADKREEKGLSGNGSMTTIYQVIHWISPQYIVCRRYFPTAPFIFPKNHNQSLAAILQTGTVHRAHLLVRLHQTRSTGRLPDVKNWNPSIKNMVYSSNELIISCISNKASSTRSATSSLQN